MSLSVFSPGERPPDLPTPGREQPLSVRYTEFWILRDCRGAHYRTDQSAVSLTVR